MRRLIARWKALDSERKVIILCFPPLFAYLILSAYGAMDALLHPASPTVLRWLTGQWWYLVSTIVVLLSSSAGLYYLARIVQMGMRPIYLLKSLHNTIPSWVFPIHVESPPYYIHQPCARSTHPSQVVRPLRWSGEYL